MNESGGNTGQGRQSSVMPTRAPPPPPHKIAEVNLSSTKKEPDQKSSLNSGKGGGLGSFWSTQYAQDASYDEDKTTSAKDKLANELTASSKSPSMQGTQSATALLSESQSMRSDIAKIRGTSTSSYPGKDYGGGPKFDEDRDDDHDRQDRGFLSMGSSRKVPYAGNMKQTTTEGFSEFVADFENASIFKPEKKDMGTESCHIELESLRGELKQVRKEVLEIATKCEKLTSICGSQQLEIQQLKSTLATANSQRDSAQTKEPVSQTQKPFTLSSQRQERQAGTIWDLEENLSSPGFSASEPQVWRALNNDVPKERGTVENDKFKTSTKYAGDLWESQCGLMPSGTGFQPMKGICQVSEGALARGVSHSSDHSQPAGWSGF